jgi:SAM-dependent methyltransferase
MMDQAHHWSRAASSYEQDFVDPYRPDVRSPLVRTLRDLADPARKTVADLGCGIGPLLPFLAEHFRRVFAIDFAEGMLQRARERCRGLSNVDFFHLPLTDLASLAQRVDVALAVNSLVMPDISELEESLRQIRRLLRPGGLFLGIVPAIDSVHYCTMLLVDRALAAGKPLEVARKNAAHHAEHALYDFAFGQFRFQGLEQHFWQPFEVRYRLRRAGFGRIQLARLQLSWEQFTQGNDLKQYPPPWDWYFQAEVFEKARSPLGRSPR